MLGSLQANDEKCACAKEPTSANLAHGANDPTRCEDYLNPPTWFRAQPGVRDA